MPTEGPKLELYNVHRIEGSVFAKVGALNREAKQAKSKRVLSFCKVPYRGYATYSFLEWLGVSLK